MASFRSWYPSLSPKWARTFHRPIICTLPISPHHSIRIPAPLQSSLQERMAVLPFLPLVPSLPRPRWRTPGKAADRAATRATAVSTWTWPMIKWHCPGLSRRDLQGISRTVCPPTCQREARALPAMRGGRRLQARSAPVMSVATERLRGSPALQCPEVGRCATDRPSVRS